MISEQIKALLLTAMNFTAETHEGDCYWDCKTECAARFNFRKKAEELITKVEKLTATMNYLYTMQERIQELRDENQLLKNENYVLNAKINKLSFIVDYFNKNRQIGHTSFLLKAAKQALDKNKTVTILFGNKQQAEKTRNEYNYQNNKNIKFISVDELNKLRGINSVMLIDGSALDFLINKI